MAEVTGQRVVKLAEKAEEKTSPTKEAGRIWRGPEVESADELISRWSSIGEYLLHKMTENAQATLITDFASGRSYTGLQLREKVLAVAAALIDGYNFKPATMVCLVYDNSDHLVILALAILVAGGSICCAYHLDPYAEVLYLAQKVEPEFLFCHSKNLRWAEQLSADLGFPVVGVPMDGLGESSEESLRLPTFRCFADLFSYDSKAHPETLARLPVAAIKPLTQQVALITMSSGTTGKPKAVSQSHWNCLADLIVSGRARTLKSFSFPCCASLDYVSGRIIMFNAIHSGYNAVILNGFEPKTYCQAIERYKAPVAYLGAASFYNLITYKDVDRYDLSSLMCVFPMGAKITYLGELRKFFAKHPNIVQVRQGFGASEVSAACLNTMTPEVYLKDCDNCGRLLPGLQAKIVEPKTGRLLGPGEQGILHFRGKTVFPGYYDMQRLKQLRKKLREMNDLNGNGTAVCENDSPYFSDAGVFDEDGFYITGDLAYFNDKEELYLIGRQKELMSCRGAKKVLPQELEEVIGTHPAVLKVCVLGIANKREPTLHCPRAFVVVRREYHDMSEAELTSRPKLDTLNTLLDMQSETLHHVGLHTLSRLDERRRHSIEEDLMDFVNERVGWEKQLTGGLVILDDIPTSRATGKMNKNYLRSLDLEQVEIYGDRSG